jgi:hypothetical protein
MNGINWSVVLPSLEGKKDADIQTEFLDAVKVARKEAKAKAEKAENFNKHAFEALHHVFAKAGKDILPRDVAIMYAMVKLDTPIGEHAATVSRLSNLLDSDQKTFGRVFGPTGGLVRLLDASGKPTAMAATLAKEGTKVHHGKVTRTRKNGAAVSA